MVMKYWCVLILHSTRLQHLREFFTCNGDTNPSLDVVFCTQRDVIGRADIYTLVLGENFCLQCIDMVRRQDERPGGKKTEWRLLEWLSVWSEVQMICIWSSATQSSLASLTSGCFNLTQVVLEKRPLNGCFFIRSFVRSFVPLLRWNFRPVMPKRGWCVGQPLKVYVNSHHCLAVCDCYISREA